MSAANTNSVQKVVFITGGSRGIGQAMIEEFSKSGWNVAACSRVGKVQSSAHLWLSCDVTKPEQVQRALEEVFKKWGRIDCVINNAGLAGENRLEVDAPDSEGDDLWRRIIDVNLNGTYYVCKWALPRLPDRTGKMINIASVLGLKGVPDATAYTAAKHAVVGFTRSLAHTVARRGITVNAICPGWTRTEMAWQRMNEIGIDEKSLVANVPLGRFVEPVEVARLAVYLASENASAITGQCFTIDGGVLA